MNIIKKIFCSVTVFCILSLLSFNAFCQCDGSPGVPDDPDSPPSSPCPLDTWVFLLAAVVLIFTVWHMRKQQKQLVSLQ